MQPNSFESETNRPVDDVVSAADPHRRFAEILRRVRDGRSVTVTNQGKPVARIVPISGHEAASGDAKAALLARLRAEPVVTIGRRPREDLCDG
jgi:prevent-host-death family protein